MQRRFFVGLSIGAWLASGAAGQNGDDYSVFWDLHCASNVVPSQKEINHPHLAGGFVAVPWDTVEAVPSGPKNPFDFSRIETHVTLWAQGGKRAILRTNIFGQGCVTEWPFSFPRWMIPEKTPWPSDLEGVYTCAAEEAHCVDVVAYLREPADAEVTLLPRVWDSPAFLSLYEDYVAALAAEYDGDPRIAMVWIGVGHGGYTTASATASGELAITAPKAGWTPALWKQYIFDVIDIYTTHFTQTPVVLPVSPVWTRSILHNDIVSDMEELSLYAVQRGASLLLNGLDTKPIKFDLTPFPEILHNLAGEPLPEDFTLIMGDDWPLWIDEERRIEQPFLSDRDEDGFRCLLQTAHFAWDRIDRQGSLMIKVLRDEIEVTNSLLPNRYRPEVAFAFEESALALAEDCNSNNISDLCEAEAVCDDGVSCTDDFCIAGTIVCDSDANDANCDNDVFCDGAEQCDPVLDCKAGPDPCPEQLCDEEGDRCVDCFTDADCDDSQFCNGLETCGDGACLAGGLPCIGQACNEGTDVCEAVECENDSDCDSGSPCTIESCAGNVCVNDCLNIVAGIPYFESFESGLGAWANVLGDEFDWTRDVDGTPTLGSGPSGDHTTGSGFYLFIETSSPRVEGDAAVLEGTCLDLTASGGAKLTFWYHMFGATIDTLNVEVSDDCVDWATVWTLSGSQGDQWIEAEINLDAYAGSIVKVRFVGTRGDSWTGDIAIDDIVVDVLGAPCAVDSDCNDGLFCNGTELCVLNTCAAGALVNCDDGVGCTDDSCDESADSCSSTANNGPCDDGLFCNGAETCDAILDCQVGTDVDCNDSVACTDDACDEGIDACVNAVNDGNCDDGLFCNGGETCDRVLGCQNGSSPCDDGVGCTDDSCDEGADTCANTVNNANCDDDLFCNGIETCDPVLSCLRGPEPCDDGVACTDDVCDEEANTCVSTPNDANCDDGRFCSGTEVCDSVLGCQSGSAPCDDGVECTDDFCDEMSDICTNLARDAKCDDGRFCTGRETCDSVFGCLPGSPPCIDDVACTDDSCDESGDSCVNTANDAICDDGLFCNGVETCHPAFGCRLGVDPCVDGVGCTDDVCDEGADTCSAIADDSKCDDGRFCNGVETCDSELGCLGGSGPCDDGVGCTDDVCHEAVDSCSNTPRDANCDDGLFCNGRETCDQALGCQVGAPPCNDGVDCTDDACDDDLEVCVHAANDTLCDDGLFCTGVETCHTIFDCQSGLDPCGDGVRCTDDVCNEAVDTCSSIANDANCDDGLFCNGAETCDPDFGCQGGSDPCSDGVACTDDSCDDGLDTCVNTPNDAHCDNGLFCNGVETCHPELGCQAGIAVDCDDGVDCTLDSCNEDSDACSNTPNDAGCDNNRFCDGFETCDPTLGCQAGSDPCPGEGCDEIGDQCFTLPTARLEAGSVVVGALPVTVLLTNTYDNPVVVCSINYSVSTTPFVTRVSNVTNSSFDVRIQNPSDGPVASENVHYLVVEEGIWTIDGVSIEAQAYLSTVTDSSRSWFGEPQAYGQSYTEPVVLGQVMSENDADWSVFWNRGSSRATPATSRVLRTGKTVCEDTLIVRFPETIGFIVFEAGHGEIGGVEFEASVGSDTVRSVTNEPPYPYAFNVVFGAVPQVAVVTMAGMAAVEGGWAYTFGAGPLEADSFNLAIDEDQIGDSERSHTSERVSYIVFGSSVVFP